MYPEPLPEIRETTRRRRIWRRRTDQASNPNGLHLQSLDRAVHVSDVLNHPLYAVLMTEDFCWRSAELDWRARKPPRWHRADWSTWRAERAELDGKRARIRELAAELGVRAGG
jgi:hypothetical protein